MSTFYDISPTTGTSSEIETKKRKHSADQRTDQKAQKDDKKDGKAQFSTHFAFSSFIGDENPFARGMKINQNQLLSRKNYSFIMTCEQLCNVTLT